MVYILGVFEVLAVVIGPFLNKLFGLPQETTSALLKGFLRKDLAMGMLAPMELTAKQLVVGGFVNFAFQDGDITLLGWLIIILAIFSTIYIPDYSFSLLYLCSNTEH